MSEIRNPTLKLNCNYVESNNEQYVLLNIQIFSYDNNIYNGSLKGQGIAREFYKKLPDLKTDSTYESEFVFVPADEFGSYNFQVYIQTNSEIFTSECSGLIEKIIKPTTTRPTTTTTRPTTTTTRPTTTTTRPTTTTTRPTTTTTRPAPSAGELLSNTTYSEKLPGCKDNRTTFEFSLTNNSEYTLEVQYWIGQNGNSSELQNTLSVTPQSTISFSNSFESYDTWFYWNFRVRYQEQAWSEFKSSGSYTACRSVILSDFSYDDELYTIRLFNGREDNPFICEYPGKGYRVNKRYGRCISWSQWYEYPNMEKGDSNWIQFCWNQEGRTYSEPGALICDY